MKVFNLQCSDQHAFEGWFSNEEDFQAQLASGLLLCPLCNDGVIIKMPSAPRLNISGAREGSPSLQTPNATPSAPSLPQSPTQGMQVRLDMQHAALKAMRHLMANSVDVGERFAEEARRIHYGETASRNIRGKATRAESESLLEEGIEFMSLPALPAFDSPLQ